MMVPEQLRSLLRPGVKAWRRWRKTARMRAALDAVIGHTDNFLLSWMATPIRQNIFDLWVTQEVLAELRPALLIEGGTMRGGSALFYAHLFDLLGSGHVITIDVETRHALTHPRITAVRGSTLDAIVVDSVRTRVATAGGPVMVILDDDHSAAHVLSEMEMYGPLVTPGSYILVQDGVVDLLPRFEWFRPGPLVAIREFLPKHPEFAVDEARCTRFPFTHHPSGWLRRLF
jgi:cephalosporin hydroxylase